jgi:hypothetical protein
MANVRPRNLKRNTAATSGPVRAKELSVAVFNVDLSASTVNNGLAGLLAADVAEIGVLPAHCKLARAEMTSVGIDAVATIDIGFLTGEFLADLDSAGAARVMAATGEIFEAVTKNQLNVMDAIALDAIAPVGYDRGIGLRVSADEAANAGESVKLIIWYYAA